MPAPTMTAGHVADQLDEGAAEDGVSAGLVRLALISALCGAITGAVGTAFRVSLDYANTLRDAVIVWAHQWPAFGWLLPMTIAGLLVAVAHWMVQRFAPLAAGSGVQHVEAVMRGEAQPAPFAVLPVKFFGGLLAIGSGLALGREGPTVQMGATIGAQLAKRAQLNPVSVRTVQGATAGAGLAVAFNAPIGGVAFVFEELARHFTTEVMVSALASCSAAVFVMRALLGNEVDFPMGRLTTPSLATVIACLVLGVLLGLLGAAYNRATLAWLNRFAALTSIPGTARAAIIGGVVGLIAWFEPRVVGGGGPLVQGVLDERLSLSLLAIVFAARWLLGPFSYAAGTPGGLFAPLLVVGAVFGAMFAAVVNRIGPVFAIEPATCAIVGMAAFFTAVVRAPLTGIVLVLGMTGTATPIIPALAACVGATIVPSLLGSAPIYDTLRERMLGRA
jgi:chloride channel protein, CIC family